MKQRPVIILCYARSGGTILNKCLSSIPGTVVMSEVNPLGGGSGIGSLKDKPLNNIQDQAKSWYNIELESAGFKDNVEDLLEHCNQRESRLIIRDWTVVNYEPMAQNSFFSPNRFLILEELSSLNPIVIGFVRNAIDVWISRGQPEVDLFFKHYYSYIKSLTELNIPIFKYEDFTKFPEEQLQALCSAADIPYAPVADFAVSYRKVNGDIQKGNESRGENQKTIKPLSRQIIAYHNIKKLNSNQDMIRSNEMLGYGMNYFDAVSRGLYFAKRAGQYYFRYRNKLITV